MCWGATDMLNILKGIGNWFKKEDKVLVCLVLLTNIAMIIFALMMYT
jgi:hypothetical protein